MSGQHGFYSRLADEQYGHVVYRDNSGREVVLTAVYETKEFGEERYAWQDREYRGVVTDFVREEPRSGRRHP